MSEENDFDVLTREVEDLRKQVEKQGIQLKILAMCVLIVMIVSYMISTIASVVGFVVILVIIIFPIALCCNSLERGM